MIDHRAVWRATWFRGLLLAAVIALGVMSAAVYETSNAITGEVAVEQATAARLPQFQFFVMLGGPDVLLAVFGVLCLLVVARKSWRALAVVIAIPVAVVVTEYVLKPMVGRTHGGSFAFPSGHVTAAAACAFGAWVVMAPIVGRGRRALGVALGAAVVGCSMSVVALGWHYPLDALGGIAVAGITVLGVASLAKPALSAHRVGQ